ncbi:transporter [Rhizobium rhizogenes]|uniref:transporter n=1 Tax=Rhizobium rhizogenes TaxID=359 RepID=UPI003ECF5EF1
MHTMLLPGRKISITQLGDAFALFNSREQHLYEIDKLAAWAWQYVFNSTAGMTRSHFLSKFSSEFRLAREDAGGLLDRYIELGILDTYASSTSVFALHLNGTRWLIECPKILSGELKELFHGIAVPVKSQWAHHHLTIKANSHRYELTADDEYLGIFAQAEIVPAVKAFLTDALLQTDFMLALHAALLRFGDSQLLIAGASGAGKTTLALALASEEGCEMLADDIVIIDETDRLRGIPFPIAVKDGSWPLLQDFYPKLAALPIHIRPDGKIVKFLPGGGDKDDSSTIRARTIVFIRQNLAGQCSLSRMHPLDAFQRLLAEAAAPRHRLTDAAFGALRDLVNTSQAFEMEVSRLEDAVQAIRGL